MVPTVFGQYLSVDANAAENFFVSGLRAVTRGPFREDELLYIASILENYSLVSSATDDKILRCPRDLCDVFDNYFLGELPVFENKAISNPDEIAGSQIMFMMGFFGTQMSGRHCLPWYAQAGTRSFFQAGLSCVSERRYKSSKLFFRIAKNFPFWVGQLNIFRNNLTNYPQQFWDLPEGTVQ